MVEHEHTADAIRERFAAGPPESYLRDWVYGGIDGIVTTFAIVSGVVGARLSPHIILILGTASLIADGFAMAAGNYLATRSEHEEFRHKEAVEHRHIDSFPEGEREEVREILRVRGVPGELLDQVVTSITSDRNLWVRIMLRDEYGLPEAVRSAWRAALVTFSAFLTRPANSVRGRVGPAILDRVSDDGGDVRADRRAEKPVVNRAMVAVRGCNVCNRGSSGRGGLLYWRVVAWGDRLISE
jgi:VIT family